MTTRNPDILKQAERLADEMSAHFPSGLSFQHLRRGAHGRRRSGAGDDFWQFRDYQPGDSTRQIDWKQSAKTDRVFLREREEAVPQTVFFYRDPSPSMQYASRPRFLKKGDYADILWLALAHMAIKSGERVSTGHPEAIATRAEKLHALYHPETGDAGMMLPFGAQSVLISDFCKPFALAERMLKSWADNGLGGIVLHISDPAEVHFPFSGHVVLQDEKDLSIDIPAAQSMQEIYQEKFRQHREQLSASATAKGFTFISIETDQPVASVLSRIVERIAGRE